MNKWVARGILIAFVLTVLVVLPLVFGGINGLIQIGLFILAISAFIGLLIGLFYVIKKAFPDK